MLVYLRKTRAYRRGEGLNRSFGPYLAEIGQVAFGATAAFALATALAEARYPGLVTNWLSPGAVLAFALAAGALSLWPSGVSRQSSLSPWMSWPLALASAILGYWAAWHYFYPMADQRLGLSLATAAVFGLTIWLLSDSHRPEPEQNN